MATAPNHDQAALWNDASGQAWVELQGVLDRMLAPFESLLVERAFPGEAKHVLDIGCGAGATTLAMARRVGPRGRVLGVDISAPLIDAARARAAGIAGVELVNADAQTYDFEPAFDALMSRFGVMFFDDPVAAFRNIRRAAKPRAALTFVAWRSPDENPFMTTGNRAAAPLLSSLRKQDPSLPGQFAFADGEKVRGILGESGFTSIEIQPIDVPITMSEDDLFSYITRLGPVGNALRDVDAETRDRVIEVLRGAFAPFVRDGEAHFTAACWLGSALAR